MTTPLIEANGVTVRYGSKVAVRDVSFSLEAGQLMGLIGPNGAGKTTLLRALAGLQQLATGEVQAMERPIDAAGEEWTVRRHVGFAPDNPPAYPELTVEQFLTFIGRAYELPNDVVEERIEFWLDALWLTDRRRSLIKALSRGMRQRVVIARALLPNPTIILLDEPAGGLDPAGRVQFRRLLGSLRDQGKALIVSSHILADLHEYCTHVGVMERGCFVRFGSVSELIDGQAHRCRYRLVLARPAPELEGLLRNEVNIERLEVNGSEAFFEFDEDRAEAAALLKRLVLADVAVASLAPMARDLEEAYLQTGVKQVD